MFLINFHYFYFMGKFKNKITLIKLNLKDEKAFAEVYDLYVEKIYRFIFFKVSNVRDAEDLTSEVFLKAWQYIKEGKNIKSVNAFLYAIARNKVIDHYRKNSKFKTVDLENDGIEKIKSNEAHPNDGLDKKIAMDNINKFLNELKMEYKEALLLKYTDDFSIDEIAQILGKTKGNVRVLIHRALEALKEIMNGEE